MKNKLSVLLVDDDYATNFFNNMIMESSDFVESISIKETGEDALQYLLSLKENPSSNLPDLIFLDINMPVQNGWEFINSCKQLHLHDESKTTLVMLTTSVESTDIQHAIEQGVVDDYLVKPLSKSQLKGIIYKFFPHYTINKAA